MKKTVELLKDELFTLICGVLFFAVALVYAASQIEITSIVFYSIALLFCGLPVFISAIKGILRRDLLDEKFLMSIASIGAIVIGDMTEGVAVMLFFRIGEFFEHNAVAKSRKSIK